MTKKDIDVVVAFELWLRKQFAANTTLPKGFKYVDYDPDLLIVTDGEDEFIIDFDVLVIRQPKEAP